MHVEAKPDTTNECCELDECCICCDNAREEIARLRAAIETAAAMVSKADPVLANALLRRLGRRPASNV